MYKSFLIICALGFSYSTNAQLYKVQQVDCKKDDVEIISGQSIPPGFVVASVGMLHYDDVGTTLDELTDEHISWMKKRANKRGLCTVFVAFDQLLDYDKFAPSFKEHESKVHFFILIPVEELPLK